MSLFKINEKYMDLLVRHDPPKSHFKMVMVNKESIGEKLGFRIGFMCMLGKTTEDFSKLVDNSIKIELVIYRRRNDELILS
ncbi:hypothetical protein MXB_2051 [Myxobolus squamalis]|nr:hypothetical protein MXB_2051 [Myxobolus squamalis]